MQAGKLDERDQNYTAVSSLALSTSRELSVASRTTDREGRLHQCVTSAVSTSEPSVAGRDA
jgi:hypothetical protein